ncbi:hypothetical protein M407DRAFT_17915 [Tulasnella calospora MUT 4182]|uniref:Uncharacterized protein n=1 Tax=Tulasnella calospora MUT 4182 TaxID=1051891 RepID=A0A0C3MI89_9AGAM|nr:hypothetical protein M407DRAFT_17915 [Tulasnella calospora MUT 4182]
MLDLREEVPVHLLITAADRKVEIQPRGLDMVISYLASNSMTTRGASELWLLGARAHQPVKLSGGSGAKAFLVSIGWTTKPAQNVTTARAYSRLGEGSITVAFAVCQIFCSRCASNIIKASRFGAEGMLRVCNLCLQKLEEEDDDEDDRRSVLSVSTNFPAHQLDLMHTGHHHASPYSTMQGGLSRSAETGNLYSIGEMRRKSSFDAFDSASRPSSPAYGDIPQDPNWEESAASHHRRQAR